MKLRVVVVVVIIIIIKKKNRDGCEWFKKVHNTGHHSVFRIFNVSFRKV